MVKYTPLLFLVQIALAPLIAAAPQGATYQMEQSSMAMHSGSLRTWSPDDSVYSVEEFVAEVLRSNPKLQSYRTRIRSAESRISQVTAWDDPQAAVEFFATPVTSLNPFRDGMETDYSLQQTIPLFGQKTLMGEVAKANARMAEQSAVAIERNLIADAKRGYAMLHSARRRLVANQENERLLAQIIESARAKYSLGLASQGDVLKVQVELAKLQNDRVKLQEEITSIEAMMNALRSKPSNTALGRIADEPPAEFKGALNDLVDRSLTDRPEIRAMRYEIEMNNADVRVARRMRFPDLMVRGMYKQMKDGTDQWAAMIGVNVPIVPWSANKYSGKIEESQLNVRVSEQALLDMQNMVRAQVSDAYAKVRSRWQQIERYQQVILPQADQALQSTLAAYQTDKADFLSLLDAFRLVQMFKEEYYMVIGEYYGALAELERAVGKDLQ